MKFRIKGESIKSDRFALKNAQVEVVVVTEQTHLFSISSPQNRKVADIGLDVIKLSKPFISFFYSILAFILIRFFNFGSTLFECLLKRSYPSELQSFL